MTKTCSSSSGRLGTDRENERWRLEITTEGDRRGDGKQTEMCHWIEMATKHL